MRTLAAGTWSATTAAAGKRTVVRWRSAAWDTAWARGPGDDERPIGDPDDDDFGDGDYDEDDEDDEDEDDEDPLQLMRAASSAPAGQGY